MVMEPRLPMPFAVRHAIEADPEWWAQIQEEARATLHLPWHKVLRQRRGAVDGRCPHCRHRPIHVWGTPDGIAKGLGGFKESEEGRDFYAQAHDITRDPNRQLTGAEAIVDFSVSQPSRIDGWKAKDGPTWERETIDRGREISPGVREVTVATILHCWKSCGATWPLLDEQLEEWYDDAVARGKPYFPLPRVSV